MLADECPEMGANSAKAINGSPIHIHLYVGDVDNVAKQATAAGATLESPVEDQFYGDRAGFIANPFGIKWYIATHIQDLSPEEIQERGEQLMQKKAANQ